MAWRRCFHIDLHGPNTNTANEYPGTSYEGVADPFVLVSGAGSCVGEGFVAPLYTTVLVVSLPVWPGRAE